MTAKSSIQIGFNKFRERRSGERLLIDPILLICSFSLLVIGLVMMMSASISVADKVFGDPFYYFNRQIIFAFVGLVVGFVVWKIPLQVWDLSRSIFLVAGLLLLVALLIPGVGHSVNGSTRWINIGGFGFQISEVIKVFMVIYLAGFLKKHQESLADSIKPVFVPMVLLFIVSLLLLAQPDFGATVVIAITVLSMLWFAGLKLRFFALISVLLGVALAFIAFSKDYRVERLTSFLDPWKDKWDSGFQLSNSLIAFGRGEWFGVGLGESVQKLGYLPEAHTDFVFAVLAEELGVVGAIVVIFLFALIAWRAFSIGRRLLQKQDYFGGYLCYGLGAGLIFQAYVNIGVNMGVLPTKGLTLPLMSYGGSSMVMSCIAIALLLRADYELRFQYNEEPLERRAK